MDANSHPNAPRDDCRSAIRAFISKQAALVLAVIVAATALLAWEWHYAHQLKSHAVPAAALRNKVVQKNAGANPAVR